MFCLELNTSNKRHQIRDYAEEYFILKNGEKIVCDGDPLIFIIYKYKDSECYYIDIINCYDINLTLKESLEIFDCMYDILKELNYTNIVVNNYYDDYGYELEDIFLMMFRIYFNNII